jgi:hypothetical protein
MKLTKYQLKFEVSILLLFYWLPEDKYPESSINRLTPESNPSAQHRLTRIFTGDFAS